MLKNISLVSLILLLGACASGGGGGSPALTQPNATTTTTVSAPTQPYQTIDSIGIPLKNSENLTVYTLTKDFNENTSKSGNEDKIYFNYNYNWNYISRACGFITTYDIQDIIIKNDSENWILNTEIIETNIIDEKNIHVKIFH